MAYRCEVRRNKVGKLRFRGDERGRIDQDKHAGRDH